MKKLSSKKLYIYTDGGCRGNPGVGSWAFAVYQGYDYKGQKSKAVELTTNNQMELQALIEALAWAEKANCSTTITIYTDSSYVQQGYKQWLGNWVRRGWKTASGTPVKNLDQWKKVHSLQEKLWSRVLVEKVKGHAGIEGNEKADSLCNERMDEFLEDS